MSKPNIKGTGVFDGFEGVDSKTGGCNHCDLDTPSGCSNEQYSACRGLPVTHWIKSAPEQDGQTCEWVYSGGEYRTDCKNSYPWDYYAESTVKFKFCPYCGKPIKEATG